MDLDNDLLKSTRWMADGNILTYSATWGQSELTDQY